tara:strand:- start:265 stop:450 length:186 start_codon:yes stop_codon:yes gene_type:complete
MNKTYCLTSERNRNIIVQSNKLDDLRAVRDKLNKIDKDFIKSTKIKINAVNFEIVENTIHD